MKLSIITINLNNYEGLKRTIESVITQTFTDYELIVIDGGSTDGSRELIEQYSNHISFWCSEPDKGIYNAMNKGIIHAHGEWLQFLNSGDWLYNENILKKVFSKQYEEEILYGDYVEYTNGIYAHYKLPSEISLHYLQYRDINHQAMFFNTTKICNIQYDESLEITAECLLFIKLALQGYKFYHLNYEIVYYEGTGLSKIKMKEASEERALVWRRNIPPLVLKDMDKLTNNENHNLMINSHKIYRFLMKITNFNIKIASKIINHCEKKRM